MGLLSSTRNNPWNYHSTNCLIHFFTQIHCKTPNDECNMQATLTPTFDTMRFIPPTLEQVKARAIEIDLPPREAEKFFLYYEANGWRTGRTKIQRWCAALAGWKLRWEEKQPTRPTQSATFSGAQIVLYSKELERVQSKLEDINYSGQISGWTAALKEKRQQFIRRKTELKKLLGITI